MFQGDLKFKDEEIQKLRAELANVSDVNEHIGFLNIELRADNERLKAQLAVSQQAVKDASESYEASCEKVGLYHRALEQLEQTLQQLERVNAELRAKLKSIVDVIDSRTKDGLTRFCADPACNCESSGAYQDLKALEKGEGLSTWATCSAALPVDDSSHE